jgi:pimeloyl-ACP methyl ester carboxylesterase
MGHASIKKSTIVRTNIARQIRGFALDLAEREAPHLGARLAVRMWLTIPPSLPGPARPQLTEPGELTLLPTPRVVTESWGTGPVVYLMHGWGGYRGQLGAFVRPLVSAGFQAVAIDAPGHGESAPGRYGRGRAAIPDFSSALRAAVEHYGPAHGLIAHSLGASAAAITVLDGLPTDHLVLIAPVSNVQSGIDIFARAAHIGPRVRAQMPSRIERLTRLPARHFDVASRAAEVEELPPALIIHDTADKEVPFDLGVLVATAWPGGRLLSTEGLGHKRILRDPQVIESAVGYLSRLPLGLRPSA